MNKARTKQERLIRAI